MVLRTLSEVAKKLVLRGEYPFRFTPAGRVDGAVNFPDGSGIYVHVPFCLSFCPYCPYLKFPYRGKDSAAFVEALNTEMRLWRERSGTTEFDSLYFGGGTPTLLADDLPGITRALNTHFSIKGPTAIETGPSELSPRVIERLCEAGVTMVSIGVQSFDDAMLAGIGRRYSSDRIAPAVHRIQRAGFNTVNLDMMFALPGQSVDMFLDDLRQAVSMEPDQITCYPLFTFPYSSVGRYRRLKGLSLPSAGLRRRMYYKMHLMLEAAGYRRSSVWSFARPGVTPFSSVTRQNYLGLGPGAATFSTERLFLNDFSLKSYLERLQAGNDPPVSLTLTLSSRLRRIIWLYWRLYETEIPLTDYKSSIGTGHELDYLLIRLLIKLLGGTRDTRFNILRLSARSSHWIHLLQNHLVLAEVARLWSRCSTPTRPETEAI